MSSPFLSSALARAPRLARAAGTGALLFSCQPGVDIPEAPDLSDIAAVYREPDGSLDEATIEAAAEQALEHLEVVYGLGKLDFVVESLTSVGDAVRETAQEDGNTIRSIDGVTYITTICPGSVRESTTDEDNGTIEYQVVFQESRLGDTVWGDFVQCQFFDSGERLLDNPNNPARAGASSFHGAMDVYLGGEIPLSTLAFETFLFRLDGSLVLPNQSDEIDLDFRLDLDGLISTRVPAAGGDVVFVFGFGGGRVGLETADGSFCCDFTERQCFDLASGSCSDAQVGDQVIRW